jgi:hypothetical protein
LPGTAEYVTVQPGEGAHGASKEKHLLTALANSLVCLTLVAYGSGVEPDTDSAFENLCPSVRITTSSVPGWLEVQLVNTSSRGILGYKTAAGRTNQTIIDSPFVSVQGTHAHQLINAGDTYRFSIPLPMRGRPVLAAVIFDDGTHEGDTGLAAQTRAAQMGNEAMSNQIIGILDSVVAEGSGDSDIREAIKKVDALRIGPDEALTETFNAEFPDSMRKYAPVVNITMTHVKAGFLVALKAYGDHQTNLPGFSPAEPRPASFSEWWRRWRSLMQSGNLNGDPLY